MPTPGYTIKALEDAIIAALEPMKADGAIKLKTLKTYAGELNSPESIKEAMVYLVPAILCVYGGSLYKDEGARKIERVSFTLFFCDKSLKGEHEARHGGANNPGAFAMMDAARLLLFGKRLGLSINPLELMRQETIWLAQGYCVYGQDWETAIYHLFEAS